jgi:hypothetical protein
MLDNADNDIGDDIRKALSSLEGGGDTPVVEAVVDDAEAEETIPEPAIEATEDRKRGADGKFVAKQTEIVQDATEQSAKAETPQESIRPPASWTPASKAKFATLDPDIQKEILKRETDVERGFRERAQKEKAFEPLEQLIAPRRALWAAQGMDEVSAIKTLLAAQDLLERDPRQGLEFLARSYGVSLNTAQPQGQPQQAQPATDSHPEIAALKQQLQTLQAQVQTAQTAPIVSQIEAFQNDPANLYFENVRDDMAVLLNNGKASDLKEAYEMACWMRPDIRPLLQTPQVVSDPAKVQRARSAGVSVTGSPAQPRLVPSNPNSSIEDDIRAALAELSGQA